MYQANDDVIPVPLSINGEPEPANNIVSATYKLYTNDKQTVVIEKSLGDGVFPIDNQLNIVFSALEAAELSGSYYHELTVNHVTYKRKTLFGQFITFKATRN